MPTQVPNATDARARSDTQGDVATDYKRVVAWDLPAPNTHTGTNPRHSHTTSARSQSHTTSAQSQSHTLASLTHHHSNTITQTPPLTNSQRTVTVTHPHIAHTSVLTHRSHTLPLTHTSTRTGQRVGRRPRLLAPHHQRTNDTQAPATRQRHTSTGPRWLAVASGPSSRTDQSRLLLILVVCAACPPRRPDQYHPRYRAAPWTTGPAAAARSAGGTRPLRPAPAPARQHRRRRRPPHHLRAVYTWRRCVWRRSRRSHGTHTCPCQHDKTPKPKRSRSGPPQPRCDSSARAIDGSDDSVTMGAGPRTSRSSAPDSWRAPDATTHTRPHTRRRCRGWRPGPVEQPRRHRG